MRYKFWFVIILPIFCSFLYGAAVPSEWDSFCQKCHSDRPGSILYNSSSKAHSVKSVACVTCHPNKGTAGHVKQSEASFKSLFKDMTLPPDVAPRQSSAMTSDDCLLQAPFHAIVAIPEEGIRGLFSFLRIVGPKVIASAATPITRRTS